MASEDDDRDHEHICAPARRLVPDVRGSRRWVYVAAMTHYDRVEDYRRIDYQEPIPPSAGLVHVVRVWAVGGRASPIRQPN